MSCRVTVVGAGRRLDATLPDSIPVAELLADVVGLLGENANGAAVEWGLVRTGGARLDPELSLSAQGVGDGTMLFLRDLSSTPPAPTVEDFAGRIATVVDAQPGRWTAAMPVGLLVWVAAGSFAAAGLAVLVFGDASGRAAAGVLGALISGLAAFAVVRAAGRRLPAAVLMLGALPVWIAGGAGLAGLAGASAAAQGAAGLAGASIGALVALAITGQVAFALIDGVLEATAVPAIALGVAAASGAGVLQAAAVLVVIELVLTTTVPVLSARIITSTGSAAMAMVRRLNEGRRVAAASHMAAALVILASCAVLSVSGGWFARGLVAATAIATALRARHYRFAAEVVPLLAAALVSLIFLELPFASWLAVGVHGAAGLAGLLIANAIVLVAIATSVRSWSPSAQLMRWLRPLEGLAVAATVPLALGVLGLYDAVVHFARGLG